MRVLLVEDHRLVADAFQVMLREVDPSIEMHACYSATQALSLFDTGQRFDLVLTDLLMPGIGGLDLLKGLRHRHLDVPVVIISASDDERHVRAAQAGGAAGFFPKALPGAELIAGIRAVLAGRPFFPERGLGRPATQPSTARNGRASAVGMLAEAGDLRQDVVLGERQHEVLQLMAEGHSNKQISQVVGIQEATVKYHTSVLFKAFGVRNRTSCVREAQRLGLIARFDDPGDAV